jgi:hypothetical protein
MLNLAVVIFAIAAVGGLILAIQHFRGGRRPWPLAILHGLGGAAGLVLLALAVLKADAPPQAKVALGLFVMAALGGFFLFAKRLQGQGLPSPVVIIHAGVAVIGFLVLALAIV